MWHKRTYLASYNRGHYCLAKSPPNTLVFWDYIRPIKETYTITIDGKTIEISKESFQALKQQLIDKE